MERTSLRSRRLDKATSSEAPCYLRVSRPVGAAQRRAHPRSVSVGGYLPAQVIDERIARRGPRRLGARGPSTGNAHLGLIAGKTKGEPIGPPFYAVCTARR